MSILNLPHLNIPDPFTGFDALGAIITDMFTQAVSIMDCSIDWDGNTSIPCTASAAEFGKELDIGGWELRRRVKVSILIADLPDPLDLPAPNDNFVLRLSEGGAEVKYRILKTRNTHDTTIELEGVDSNHP
jgi:hypothetical protein